MHQIFHEAVHRGLAAFGEKQVAAKESYRTRMSVPISQECEVISHCLFALLQKSLSDGKDYCSRRVKFLEDKLRNIGDVSTPLSSSLT